MDTTRRDTKIAGVLILVGMLAGALSIVPVLERPDYLTLISAHDSEIVLGAGAQLLMILPTSDSRCTCIRPRDLAMKHSVAASSDSG